MTRAFEAVSDANQYLVIGSFGRGFALGQTVEDLTDSVPESSRRFRDVDIINKVRPLHPTPGFFMTSDEVKIDTSLARDFRPLSDDSSDWGFFDRFRSEHLDSVAAVAGFSLESLGVQVASFSDNSDKTVSIPDACGFLLVQEALGHLYGNRSFKHSEQYAALEANRRQLCLGCDHAELEKSIGDIERYRELCPPPTRNKIKEYIGGFAPHLLQNIIEGKIGNLYRKLKGAAEPASIDSLEDLLT